MPTYNEMVLEAIKALKERNGSSIQAIKKHITANPSLNFTPHQMRSALKKGVESGKFVKVKGSYKLSAEAKKPPPKVKIVKKVAPKNPTKKPASVKKLTAKKATTTKTKKVTTAKKSITTKKSAAKKPVITKKATSTKKTVTKKSAMSTKKTASPKKAAPEKTAVAKSD